MNIREKQSVTSTDAVISSSAGKLDNIPRLGLQTNNKYPRLLTMTVSLRSTAVLSSREHERRSREIRALPPQFPRGFSALARLYYMYLARPTKTAITVPCYPGYMTVCQGPFDPEKSTIVCSVRETSHFDTKSFQYKSFWYKLKQWNCTKMLFTSGTVCEWTRKTFWVNILRSLSQVRGTIYTSNE